MLKNHLEFLSLSDIQAIHDTSMQLLSNVGIKFPQNAALHIFQAHGFKVDGHTVYFTESQVMDALKSVPAQFSIHARNPQRDVQIGGGKPVFAPGYGAPFLVDDQTGKRIPTLEDYHNLVKLAHVLPHQDLSGHLMVEPQDIPSQTASFQMLYANMIHSDKPFIGSTAGAAGAQHTLEMIKILFGDRSDQSYTCGLINTLSPLGFASDMIDALIAYARAHQPVIVAALIMAGATGPITLAGVLALQNAEQLAGITLTQLINPGTPAIYGSASTNTDMRTAGLAIGGPELSMIISAHAQLARFYKLPSRGGGALTDSNLPDAQAGYESMLSLLTSINSGIDFILHAGGMLSSYLAFSYEKFILDDELCGMMRHYSAGIPVNPETLAYTVTAKVAHGGHFLAEPQTLERCRTEFWQPTLSDRSSLETWWAGGQNDAAARSHMRWVELLSHHVDPPLDALTSRQLAAYVEHNLG